jgi:hypothetical protein
MYQPGALRLLPAVTLSSIPVRNPTCQRARGIARDDYAIHVEPKTIPVSRGKLRRRFEIVGKGFMPVNEFDRQNAAPSRRVACLS